MKNQVVYVVGEIFVAVLGLIGNTLVVYVFLKNVRLRSFHNYYIVGLAVADLLMGAVCIPLSILASFGLPSNFYGCLMTFSAITICCAISILCLLAVSVDRFWATFNPISYYKNMSATKGCGILGFCAVLGTLVGLLPIFGWHNPNDWHSDGHSSCRFNKVMSYDFLVFFYFSVIVLPAIAMAFFYAYIYHFIRILAEKKRKAHQRGLKLELELSRIESNGQELATPAQTERAQRKEARAGNKLISIIVFFMFCWLPLNTINCVLAFCSSCKIPYEFIQFGIILSHANSAVNPFLYAYHLQEFRIAMKKSLLVVLNGITCGIFKNTATSQVPTPVRGTQPSLSQ